jgi:hypothetical protein
MGNASRVVVVGAMSLVVGIYGLSLKRVQTADMDASMMPVKRVQFEHKVAADVRSAMNWWVGTYENYKSTHLGSKPPSALYSTTGTSFGGGTFSYTFNYSNALDTAGLRLLPPVAYQDSVRRVITGVVENSATYSDPILQGPRKMRRGTWQVTKFFVQRGW